MKYFFVFIFAVFIAFAVFVGSFYSDVRFEVYKIIDYKPKLSTQIYDANSTLIANIFDEENRQYATYDEIPARIIEALVAIEDTVFFEHDGINLEAIFRAFIKDIKMMKLAEGASTITQQLIKNIALSKEKKFSRKFKEMILAYEVERLLSKEQILERYFNHVYFGHGYYGIKTAAFGYFRKNLKDLSLKEMAILVGLPKAPSSYDPTKHLDLALSRANRVIYRMNELGWINQNEYKMAMSEIPQVFDDTLTQNKAPYIVDEVIKEASKYLSDIKTGGYQIYTGVDLSLQEKAREALVFGYNEILNRDENASKDALNGAIVAINPQSGDILALVGGVDYKKSNFNRATQTTRQVGSSFKPFVYQIALNLGYSPMSRVADVVRVFERANDGEDWIPKNFKERYKGFITLQDALRDSRNLATINLLNQIGLDVAYKKLLDLGFKGVVRGLSMALGSFGISPLEFSKFYTIFPNLGEMVEPKFIKKIVNKDGAVQNFDAKRHFVYPPEQAYLMVDMLMVVAKYGTGRRGNVQGIEIGAKTGTTNDNVDAWYCGFTPELEVLVWYGNDDNTPMNEIEGGARTAGPVFKKFVEDYLAIYPNAKRKFDIPNGVKTGNIDGKRALYTETSPLPSTSMDNLKLQENEGLMF